MVDRSVCMIVVMTPPLSSNFIFRLAFDAFRKSKSKEPKYMCKIKEI